MDPIRRAMNLQLQSQPAELRASAWRRKIIQKRAELASVFGPTCALQVVHHLGVVLVILLVLIESEVDGFENIRRAELDVMLARFVTSELGDLWHVGMSRV